MVLPDPPVAWSTCPRFRRIQAISSTAVTRNLRHFFLRRRISLPAVRWLVWTLLPLIVISVLVQAGVFGSAARIVYPFTVVATYAVILTNLWRAALRHEGRSLLGWLCMAIMSTLAFITAILWLYVYPDGAMRDRVELPELLYLTAIVFSWLGFAFLRAAERKKNTFDIRVFLDVALLARSGLALAWYFLIKPFSTGLFPGSLPGSVVDITPYAQVALFTLAGQVLLQRENRQPSRLFAIALLITMAADTLLSLIIKDVIPLNTGVTVAWATGSSLLALDAGRSELPPERRQANRYGVSRPDRIPGVRLLPYAVATGSLGLLMFHVHLSGAGLRERQYGFMISTAILALLLLRQLLTLNDNQRLGRQLVAANRELHHQATHDHLTGLLNHAGFSARFATSLEDAGTEGTELALLFLDFDSFKLVNDRHGHVAGDELLQEAARRINAELDAGQYAARLGGDEFLVVLPSCSAAEAAARADELCRCLAKPYGLLNGLRLNAGVSVGYSVFPTDGQDAATLMKTADRAMYYDKR